MAAIAGPAASAATSSAARVSWRRSGLSGADELVVVDMMVGGSSDAALSRGIKRAVAGREAKRKPIPSSSGPEGARI
jgi:hypothetical protein